MKTKTEDSEKTPLRQDRQPLLDNACLWKPAVAMTQTHSATQEKLKHDPVSSYLLSSKRQSHITSIQRNTTTHVNQRMKHICTPT